MSTTTPCVLVGGCGGSEESAWAGPAAKAIASAAAVRVSGSLIHPKDAGDPVVFRAEPQPGEAPATGTRGVLNPLISRTCIATIDSACTSSTLGSAPDSLCSVTTDSRLVAPTAMIVDFTIQEATQLSASVSL